MDGRIIGDACVHSKDIAINRAASLSSNSVNMGSTSLKLWFFFHVKSMPDNVILIRDKKNK
jgi:hypothetical protein